MKTAKIMTVKKGAEKKEIRKEQLHKVKQN